MAQRIKIGFTDKVSAETKAYCEWNFFGEMQKIERCWSQLIERNVIIGENKITFTH